MIDALVLPTWSEVAPPAWLGLDRPAVFNPALIEEGNDWIAAFRVVAQDGQRRISLCHLDADLKPRPGSATAWSDAVTFAPGAFDSRSEKWFADPRLYRWEGRLYVYWNTGWHEPHNHQFIQETDPRSLLPLGRPIELRLRDLPRRPLEKNWLFFGPKGEHVLYSPSPLRIHAALPREGLATGPDLANQPWDRGPFGERFGQLRGGAPPVEANGDGFVICHAVSGTEGDYRYRPFALRFELWPPFRVTGIPNHPLPLPNPFGAERCAPKLNPAVGEVIYPCGAVYRNGGWVVSYGINDERAAFCRLSHQELLETLADVG